MDLVTLGETAKRGARVRACLTRPCACRRKAFFFQNQKSSIDQSHSMAVSFFCFPSFCAYTRTVNKRPPRGEVSPPLNRSAQGDAAFQGHS